ncbi:MAG: response regulator, partial [Alphaproteobacteria bacterium]|nr:response regulator [Alphaproteobacteria bacterium]
SHEIRTPLNGLLGTAEALLDLDLPAEAEGHVLVLKHAGQHLLSLINDILDLSRLSAGRLDVEKLPFELDDMLEGVASIMGGLAAEKRLDLVFAVDGDVPTRPVGDAARLRQVLVNLVGNAIKFTAKGGVGVTIARRGDGIRVEVEDSGIGVPAEARDRLFDVFTQLDAGTTRVYGGSGLGLAISRRLVEAMGGRIGVDSEVGRGSTFWFEIPATGVAAPLGRPLAGRRLLLAEDPTLAGRILSRQLAAWGGEVVIAADRGAVAKAFAALGPKDAALAIAREPGDLAEALRRAGAETRGDKPDIVIVSADADIARENADGTCRLPAVPSRLLAAFGIALPERKAARATQSEIDLPPGLRVLVAEDNPVNRMVVGGLLQRWSCETRFAVTGAEAVDAVRGADFDVVLMDLHMPVMDGFEAMRRIRAMPGPRGKLRAIALTADTLASGSPSMAAVGFDAVVLKPFERRNLLEAINRVVKGEGEGTARAMPELRAIDQPRAGALDHEAIKSLIDGVGWGDVRRLLDLQMTQAEETATAARKALAQNDARRLAGLMHFVKSSAGALGLAGLRAAAVDAEAAARIADLPAAADQVARFGRALEETRKAVEALAKQQSVA